MKDKVLYRLERMLENGFAAVIFTVCWIPVMVGCGLAYGWEISVSIWLGIAVAILIVGGWLDLIGDGDDDDYYYREIR